MAKLYKTPGVYIEEIPKFPPSIAPVETAIPAFIGYTEKAIDKLADDLHLKPFRITSLLEYETHFGVAQKEQKMSVTILATQDSSGNQVDLKTVAKVTENDRSRHIMYYAMQMYFANGGGDRKSVV